MDQAVPVSITSAPQEDQLVEHEGQTYRTIREGLAYILVPPNVKTSQAPQKGSGETTQAQNVFYNPIQQFNRDLSVLAIKAFGEDLCERRRAKWEQGRERLAVKKERKKDRKRKRLQDEQTEEVVKVQRLDEDVPTTAGGEAAAPDVDTVSSRQELGDTNGDAQVSEQTPQAAHDDIVRKEASGDVDMAGRQDPEDVDKADRQEPEDMSKADRQKRDDFDKPDRQNPEDIDDDEQAPEQTPQSPPFRILDALSATGLRALRYAQEIPFATSITANDMDRKAVKSIEMHLKHNRLTHKIEATTSNALAHMYAIAYPPTSTHGPSHISGKYDVIDLDPYGTAAPFIDAALQALNDGGLLCVTCTDSGVFASCGYSEKTFSLYGGNPVKGNHSHEAGLRLIAHSIATAGAKYGIAIEPLLSLSIDFYARLFIRTRRSPADVKFLAGKTMIVYECDAGCGAWTTQLIGRNTQHSSGNTFKHSMAQGPSADRLCEHCGSKAHIAGPMWAGPLHHPAFVEKILADARVADKSIYGTTARLEGMLDTALDELLDTDYVKEPHAPNSTIPKLAPESLDRQPFFFNPSTLARAVHCQAPREAAVKGALRHAGYRATRSHCKAGSVKTNAPWSAIWDIYREWVKQNPVKVENIREGSVAWKLLRLGVSKEDTSETTGANGKPETKQTKVVFDEALGRDKTGKKLVRYQTNPRENWGPMSRAK